MSVQSHLLFYLSESEFSELKNLQNCRKQSERSDWSPTFRGSNRSAPKDCRHVGEAIGALRRVADVSGKQSEPSEESPASRGSNRRAPKGCRRFAEAIGALRKVADVSGKQSEGSEG